MSLYRWVPLDKSLQTNVFGTTLVPDGVWGGQGERRWARQPWFLPTRCLLFSEGEFREIRQLRKTKRSPFGDVTACSPGLICLLSPHCRRIFCWALIPCVKYHCSWASFLGPLSLCPRPHSHQTSATFSVPAMSGPSICKPTSQRCARSLPPRAPLAPESSLFKIKLTSLVPLL